MRTHLYTSTVETLPRRHSTAWPNHMHAKLYGSVRVDVGLRARIQQVEMCMSAEN